MMETLILVQVDIKKIIIQMFMSQINNDFNFTSYDFFTNKGLVSNYNLLLKNYNTYSENSDNFEENNDHELFTTISLNTKFPLQKELLEYKLFDT